MEKKALITDLKNLSNLLDEKYSDELNLRNHCFLRIAYDCTIENKWDLVIKKPFLKFAAINHLMHAIALLNLYSVDKQKLIADNAKSLCYRKGIVSNNTNKQTTLF